MEGEKGERGGVKTEGNVVKEGRERRNRKLHVLLCLSNNRVSWQVKRPISEYESSHVHFLDYYFKKNFFIY